VIPALFKRLGRIPVVLLMVGAALLGADTPALAVDGGNPVTSPNPYPYVGFVITPDAEANKFYVCTSTLVNQEWVLTAKHCITTPGYNTSTGRAPISVKLNYTRASDGNVVHRDVRQFVLGDGFDLALLRIDSVSNIVPIKLATRDDKASYKNGIEAVAVGWGGNLDMTIADPGSLRVGEQIIWDQIYSQAQFVTGYNYLLKTVPGMVTPSSCSGQQPQGPPSASIPPERQPYFQCEPTRTVMAGGDSGGPLIGKKTVAEVDQPLLIGVASQGNYSDDGVYTKVGSTIVWITEKINS
jgi:secreted trypsin-like serine protease